MRSSTIKAVRARTVLLRLARGGVGVRRRACDDVNGFPSSGIGLEVALSDVKQLNPGAASSLNGLYRRYSSWLGQRLRTRVGPDEAADVVQETYLRVIPYLLDDIRHPKALLLRVALNLVRDEKRRAATRDRLSSGGFYVSEAAPAEAVDRLQLKQILQTMPPMYRDVFVLSRFDGMTYSEIALAHGISLATVERRMAKALEHCMAQLDV